ncbi:uncharacterized protein MELLADRAFT_66229 [Melampsora larici-populina 98AG31]|uniref:Uncharacterized protein n=1 Tax=Melampsora larici-populina (strain 98AG31 / pathotype 3-4-7) TaxID=747676 RepID=F4RYB9_MELLP|nr:uncharacterized protein MELLADRAFT_66229 [Melampsora larici-populina 98AG31]EGG02663.1 hypothetical protein MELLADRAFT_66229 [Melampsora larici-populina 98AG31]
MLKTDVNFDQVEASSNTQNVQDHQGQVGIPDETDELIAPGQDTGDLKGGDDVEGEGSESGSDDGDTQSDSADIKPLELKTKELAKLERRREEERLRLEESRRKGTQHVGLKEVEQGVPIDGLLDAPISREYGMRTCCLLRLVRMACRLSS